MPQATAAAKANLESFMSELPFLGKVSGRAQIRALRRPRDVSNRKWPHLRRESIPAPIPGSFPIGSFRKSGASEPSPLRERTDSAGRHVAFVTMVRARTVAPSGDFAGYAGCTADATHFLNLSCGLLAERSLVDKLWLRTLQTAKLVKIGCQLSCNGSVAAPKYSAATWLGRANSRGPESYSGRG
jgi:hypothetical protein